MTLRIISGQFRRRLLKTPQGIATRPYTDRVRQIVFDRLADRIVDARVADVFSGVGTMGIESISRGAASCVFIESDRDVHGALKQNVDTLISDYPTVCWQTNVHRTSFRPKGAEDCLPYTMVFFDPPYKQCPLLEEGKPLNLAIRRLAKSDVTSEECIVLLRTPERFDLPDLPAWTIDDCWRVSTMKVYTLKKSDPT